MLMDTSVGCRIIFRNAKGSLHSVPGQRPIESSCRDPCSFCCHPGADRPDLDMIHLHAGFQPKCPTLCLRVQRISYRQQSVRLIHISRDASAMPYVASLISRRPRAAQSPRCDKECTPNPNCGVVAILASLPAFQDVSLLEM